MGIDRFKLEKHRHLQQSYFHSILDEDEKVLLNFLPSHLARTLRENFININRNIFKVLTGNSRKDC